MALKVKLPNIDWAEAKLGEDSAQLWRRPERVQAPSLRVSWPSDGPSQDLFQKTSDAAYARLGKIGKALGMDAGLNEEAKKKQGARMVLGSGAYKLEVFRASGAFRLMRKGAEPGQTGNGPDTPAKIPDNPIEAANEYLKAHDLGDVRARVTEVHYTEVTKIGADGNAVSFPIETHVEYRFWIHGIPVVGPGAKMRVTFGHDGEVSSVLKLWRDPSADADRESVGEFKEVQAKDHIRRRLKNDSLLGNLRRRARLRVKSIALAYYAASPREVLPELVPVFAVTCTASMAKLRRHDFVRYITAYRLNSRKWDTLGAAFQAHVLR